MAAQKQGGLQNLDLTLEQAVELAYGKQVAVARYCLRFGYFEEARVIYEQIVADNPEKVSYRSNLVDACIGCGDLETAEHLSQKLLKDFPESRYGYLVSGRVKLAQDQPEAAQVILAKCMERPIESISFWAWLGAAAQRRGEWELARQALDRALAIRSSRQPEESEEQGPPIYLLQALVEQGEHDGTNVENYRRELEQLHQESLSKTLEKLTKPDSKSQKPGKSSPVRSAEIPPAERVVAEEPLAEVAPNPELAAKLQSYFGFGEFRPGQQEVIERILRGGSVLATMPTGAGKSLCYQLPAMLLPNLTVVISPLIALMKDQLDGLPAQVQRHATLINSSLEGDEIDRRLRDIRGGRYKLVYAAPERLRQRPFLHTLRTRGVSLFVIDEAHCVSMWGHDFRPDYLFIGNALRYVGDPPVLAMTATATPEMRLEISNHLGRQLKVVTTGTYRPNLFLESIVVRTDEDKMRTLIELCRETDGPGIIYTRSRKKAEELARILRRERVQATFYHAGMEPEERTRTQEEFMDGRWRVICATVAFGMGIDKSDVRFVVHFSLPQSLEDYSQESGRAGRDGFPSRCILLSTPSDKARVTRWMRDEQMDVELPRQCYSLIRELTQQNPYAAIRADEFERELGGDETKIRVAISMLENVGLIKRHLDIPTTLTVCVLPQGMEQGNADFTDFVQAARLRVSQRIPLETLELAGRAGVNPGLVEEKLLDWHSQGWMYCNSSGRVMLLERLPAAANSKKLLEELLTRHISALENRARRMFGYVESNRCRHDLIAEHFGAPLIENCRSCDNCTGQAQPGEKVSRQARPAEPGLTDQQKMRKILETVEQVPGKVGYTGLVRILKGSVASFIKRDQCPNFGILANEPKATIERCVQELLESEYLVRDEGEYRLISLGPRAKQARF